MKIDIEGIKDAVYEFEGLLELAELREDKLQALLPLMKNKLDIINTLFNDASEDEDIPDVEEEEETVTIADEEPISISEDDEPVSLDIISAYDEKDVEPSDINIVSMENISDDEEELPEVKESEPEDEEPMFVASDDDQQEEIVSSKLFADAAGPKPAFCINDRFRFRRELFNNSDADFNAAMDLVATMDDYEEAEDHFIGDLGWDFEKPEVMDFMAIIRNYFDK